MHGIQAILFDKDGTLFDFQATWGGWACALLAELAGGHDARAEAMAQALRFDRRAQRFWPDSPVIAGTGHEVAALLSPWVSAAERPGLEARLARAAIEAPLVPAVPLRPLLAGLRYSGLRLGIASNDFESVVRRHVADVAEFFDFVAGFDSGFGGKPDPGMLLAFARHVAVPAAQVLMVGDSRHDLIAGRAAGMATLGVLTGVATKADLAPLADFVRPDIGHLPQVLSRA